MEDCPNGVEIIKVRDIIIEPVEGQTGLVVSPCGGVGTFDLKTKINFNNCCGTEVPTFINIVGNEAFTNVSVDAEQILTWTFNQDIVQPGCDYCFVLEFRCNCKKGTFKVTMTSSLPCTDVTCPANQECDKCGNCIPSTVDLGVSVELIDAGSLRTC